MRQHTINIRKREARYECHKWTPATEEQYVIYRHFFTDMYKKKTFLSVSWHDSTVDDTGDESPDYWQRFSRRVAYFKSWVFITTNIDNTFPYSNISSSAPLGSAEQRVQLGWGHFAPPPDLDRSRIGTPRAAPFPAAYLHCYNGDGTARASDVTLLWADEWRWKKSVLIRCEELVWGLHWSLGVCGSVWWQLC